MLLNSGLTSNETPPALHVVFGNILDDSEIHKGVLSQCSRLPGIADSFVNMLNTGGSTIAEGASEENLRELADRMGLLLKGEAFQYSPREWMGISTSPNLEIDQEPQFIRYGRAREGFYSGFLALKVAGIDIRLVHHPHHVFSAIKDRKVGTQKLLDSINPDCPTIIMGDFNAVEFQRPRTSLLDVGFIEVHQDVRPSYPNRNLVGRSFPPLININVDGIYVSNHFKIKNVTLFASDFSDHGFLSTELEL